MVQLLKYGVLFSFTLACLVSCRLNDPLEELSLNEVISIKVNVESLPADNESEFIIIAKLGDFIDPNETVNFSSTYGVFTSGSSPGTSSSAKVADVREATMRLKVTDIPEGSISITAEYMGFQSEYQLETTTSYPDEIVLNPSELRMRSNRGSSNTISVTARKNEGEVSEELFAFIKINGVEENKIFINHPLEVTLNKGAGVFIIQSFNDSIGTFELECSIVRGQPPGIDTVTSTLSLEVE